MVGANARDNIELSAAGNGVPVVRVSVFCLQPVAHKSKPKNKKAMLRTNFMYSRLMNEKGKCGHTHPFHCFKHFFLQ